MRYRTIVLAGVCFLLLAAQETTRILHPIAAGTWYPADRQQLRATIAKCFEDASGAENPGRCVACIVPDVPYQSFGSITASPFKAMRPGQYDRVIVLAPAEFAQFRGCSIPSVQIYRTPLGDVPLDGPAIRELGRAPLIEIRSVQYGNNPARAPLHEREHAIEVLLPLLQVQLGTFKLVPIIVGDFVDYHDQPDDNAVASIVEKLRKIIDERTLVVVISNFTRHGNTFSYRPFRQNIIEGIEFLDRTAFDLILTRNYQGFQDYLQKTKNPIIGRNAISILLKLLPRNAEGGLFGYDVSARRSGDTKSSISYAALAFFEPTTPTHQQSVQDQPK